MTANDLYQQVINYYCKLFEYRIQQLAGSLDRTVKEDNLKYMSAALSVSLDITQDIINTVTTALSNKDPILLDWGIKGLYYLKHIEDPIYTTFNITTLEIILNELQTAVLKKGEVIPGFQIEQTNALWSKPISWPPIEELTKVK